MTSTSWLAFWVWGLCFLQDIILLMRWKGACHSRQNNLHLLLLKLYFLCPPAPFCPLLCPPHPDTLSWLRYCLLKCLNWINPHCIGLHIVVKKWSCGKRMTCSRGLRQVSSEWRKGTGGLLSPRNSMCWVLTWKQALAVSSLFTCRGAAWQWECGKGRWGNSWDGDCDLMPH